MSRQPILSNGQSEQLLDVHEAATMLSVKPSTL